jgi:hypothetical protein
MSDTYPELSPDLMLDREAIEAARRSAFAVSTHRPEDFDGMRRAVRLAAEVLDLLTPEVAPGVTTAHLDKLAFEYAMDHGALPACLGYRGYRHTLCTSVNHVVCHGIPADRPLKDGDILNIDVTLVVEGWHGDTSRMYYVGEVKRKAQRLVEITYEAMMRGIQSVKPGATTGDIGYAIQSFAEEQERCSVVRDFRVPRASQYRPLWPAGSGRRAETRNVLHRRADDQSRRLCGEGVERRLDGGDARPFAFRAIRAQHRRDAGWIRNLHPLAERTARAALQLSWPKRGAKTSRTTLAIARDSASAS